MDGSFKSSATTLASVVALAMIPAMARAAVVLLGPNITPANQSQTVIEGSGKQTFQ